MEANKPASVAEIKRYFEINSMQEMKNQWQVLNEAEKEFFRVEVGKIIHG